jgi:polar amino acid transport system substrate-binding protein
MSALLTSLTLLMPGLAAATETIRIAAQDNFPPFVEVKDGKPTGLVVDILEAAATKAGFQVQFVLVPFAEVQSTLDDGRAQAIVPLAITPERQKSFDFSDPVLMTGGAFFVRAPQPTPKDIAALDGKTVVTPRTGPLVPFLQKNDARFKLVLTKDYPESLAQVMTGKADAAALNFQVGASMAAELYPGKITRPFVMFTEVPDAVAVRKGRNADVLGLINLGMAAIRTDGTWQKINDRWTARWGVSLHHRWTGEHRALFWRFSARAGWSADGSRPD